MTRPGYSAARSVEQRERDRERSRRYDARHRAEAVARTRAWAAADTKRKKASDRASYVAHAEKRKAKAREYRAAHLDRMKKAEAAWRAAHPGAISALAAARRARQRSATVGDPDAIKAIYRRAKENVMVRCYLCGKLIPMGQRHVDHVVPLARGGAHAASNLAIACAHCNLSKHAKLPQEVGLLI